MVVHVMSVPCTRCSTYNPRRARFCARCGVPAVVARMAPAVEAHESIAGAYLAACVLLFGLASLLASRWADGVALTPVGQLGADGAVALALWIVLCGYLRLPLWSCFVWVGGWVAVNGWFYVGAEWLARTHPRVDPFFVVAARGLLLGFLTWAALLPARVSCLWMMQTTCAVLLAYLMPCVLVDLRFPLELYARVSPMVVGALFGIAQGPCLLSASPTAGRRATLRMPVGVVGRAMAASPSSSAPSP